MLEVLDIGASGLAAQRTRLDTIAMNVLQAQTTRDAQGRLNPYRRRFVVFQSGQAGNPANPGVHVRSIEQDMSPFNRRYIPGHPDADANGYVSFPNVDLAVENVNAIEASRAYEANITMMEVTKSMFAASLRLIA